MSLRHQFMRDSEQQPLEDEQFGLGKSTVYQLVLYHIRGRWEFLWVSLFHQY